MPSNFDQAFERVKQLVADFKAHEPLYLSAQFSEAQARKDFIDKFLMALGWDVNHETQKNPYEQEVKVERNESGSQRRADYAFFLAPNFRDVQFFVEAKKPHGEFGSPDNYFQTLRYGWSSKTPLAILTNFDEFHILDSRYKPHIGDTLSRVVKRFAYTDYSNAEKFAEIYWLFSREAVAGNSLAKFAETLPKPKSQTFRRELFKGGYQSLDESFLIELDGYRAMLARAFKSKNPKLDSEQLTEITQRTLDRLVFIRFLEDKHIEPARRVERFGDDGGSAWEDFLRVSINLDRIYNGVVFKRHEIIDAPGFQIDEKPFRIICEELSDPTSPYNFDSVPIHILGSIYERFLGKIITNNADLVEKPEIRKAGGVYYTPEYIVRYIVSNTVGKAIEGKSPEEISGMRFADIACGSGSFLIEIFDILLRHHAKFYNDNPGKAKNKDCIKRDDGLHLSLKKKQEILKNNIYGVDIDRQAVEVAQLSLYLKLLDDETIGSAAAFQNEFHFTLLPPLTDNIACGNSLIGTDIFETGNLTPEEEKKLNPMDFEQRFPQIFRRKDSRDELRESAPGDLEHNVPGGMPLHGGYAKTNYSKRKNKKQTAQPPPSLTEFEGGFDAIIGNPPYVFGRDWKELKIPDYCKDYFRGHYTASPYQLDMFSLFMERAVKKTRFGGYVGLIVPDVWLTNTYSSTTRNFILRNARELLLTKPPPDVFAGIIVDTVVFTLALSLGSGSSFKTATINPKGVSLVTSYPVGDFIDGKRPISLGTADILSPLIKKLLSAKDRLANVAQITRGVHPYRADGFGKSAFGKGFQTKRDVEERPYNSLVKKSGYREFIYGKDLRRLTPPVSGEYIKYGPWLAEPRTPEFFEGKRVYSRKILADRLVVTVESKNTVADQQVYITKSKLLEPSYLAGILGSKLIAYFIRSYFDECTAAFPQIKVSQLRELPLPNYDPSKVSDKSRYDKMVSLVGKMLEARQKLVTAKTDGDKDFYENKCAGLDHQIDALVYELYDLTADEIKIVEGAAT